MSRVRRLVRVILFSAALTPCDGFTRLRQPALAAGEEDQAAKAPAPAPAALLPPAADAPPGIALLFYHKTGTFLAHSWREPVAALLNLTVLDGQNFRPVRFPYQNKSGGVPFEDLIKGSQKLYMEVVLSSSYEGNVQGQFFKGPNRINETEGLWPAERSPGLEINDLGGRIMGVQSPSDEWPVPARTRVLHFYRNPINLVTSALLYHSNNRSAEPWSKSPRTCHLCDEESNKVIFQNCSAVHRDGRCTYYEILTHSPLDRQVFIESHNSRGVIQTAYRNLMRWRADPRVLHISIEEIGRDPDAAFRCVSRFLGAGHLPLAGLLGALQGNYTEHKSADDHATSSKFGAEAQIRELLRRNRAWIPGLDAAEALEREVSERQGRLYGCPAL